MLCFETFRPAFCVAVCLIAVGVTPPASAQGYAFTALSNIDGTPTIAFAMNNSGTVVGSSAGRA